MTPTFPADAEHIIRWAQGERVDLDCLINELEDWSNYFAPTAALWDDAHAIGDQIDLGGAK